MPAGDAGGPAGPRPFRVGRHYTRQRPRTKREARLDAARARAERGPPALVATPVQQKFLDALWPTLGADGELHWRYNYLAMGGGIRGTKTWTLLQALIALCMLFPRSRWALVRKNLPVLRRNTIPSFNALRATCLGFVGPVVQATWTATCRNGSQLIFFPESAEQDPDRNRWRGLEVNGLALEEANELEEASWDKSVERAGSYIIPPTALDPSPRQPPPLILGSFNPCDNWPREKFYEPHMAGTIGRDTRRYDDAGALVGGADRTAFFYQPATIADNPFAPAAYLASLKYLPPDVYQKFVLGNWGITDQPDQLISYAWIRAAADVPSVGGVEREGLDVAWEGDDDTVFCRLKGNTLAEMVAHHGMRPTDVETLAMTRIARDRLDCSHYWIDGVGMGAPMYDHIRARGFPIQRFIAGASAVTRPGPPLEQRKPGEPTHYPSILRFADLRSQGWWELAEKLRLGRLCIPQSFQESDVGRRLVKDLLAMRRSLGNDRLVTVWPKKKFKKETGHSSDYGDALMQAAFDAAMTRLHFTAADFAGARVTR